ncbi:DUF72 domain-containing protein [Pandoraea vervacti]|nr:DUF72 domain-containing protein [Pandoraea vervacti]
MRSSQSGPIPVPFRSRSGPGFRLPTGHQTPRVALPKDLQSELPPGPRANVYYKDMSAPLIDEIWRRYLQAIEPLREAGKLGLVHFQFPPWLNGDRASHAHVEACAQRMSVNYDYREAELAALVDPIRVIAKVVARVYVVFNTNYEDQGQRNAMTLMQLLDR